ncbi:DUF6273 domain-containing protein [uncultured Holdemanella sp.]|uniref:DUF6273 domain-containing protein n=1 Tax=uncultured Holdemanella sp. TaxID=1763549 RepID=UPI0025EFA9F5|nr:DUF6273 domain-containing protein [uncultured Holdemanella sp.]
MKNMKKFITLCGFLILGSITCGDADVVKAEAINEQTTDTSGYTITIPSEISFSTDTTNFDISAGLDKSTQIIITASSQNGFNLTNRDDTIPYSISDNLITLSNSRPDISNTVSQSLNIFIDKSKNPMYSGDYKDTLTFNIQEKQLYTLNVNGLLDGNTVSWLNGYGTFGIKINGRTISNLTDFYQSQVEGTTYEIFNIKATDGKHYIGDTIIKGTFDSPYQEINLKFDTNKLTLNYHADGAQSWNDFGDIVQNVSNKDVVYSETKKYGDTFDSQDGLANINRLIKKGYTAVANTWTIKEAGNKKVMDNVGLAKMEDVADYCGVLDEFKKNDTVIDLYPIWTANTYTLTVNPNGGLINGDGSSKVLDTKLYFDTGNYWKDSSYVNPNNLTVYAQWKKAPYSTGTVLNIEGNDYIVMGQTEDGNYRLISGTNIRNIQYQPNVDSDGNYKVGTYEPPNETRPDGQYSNTYEGSYIDNYLENTWYKQLPEKLQKAIQATDIKQVAYNNTSSNPKWRWSGTDWYYNEGTTENPKWVIYNKANIPDDAQGAYPMNGWKYSEKGYNNTTYNTISRRVFLPSVEEVSNLVDLNNANKVYNFLKGTNNSLYHMWLRDSNSCSPRSTVYLIYADRSMDSSTGYVTYDWVGVRPAFVIDLSKVDYTVTGTVNYK